MCRREHRGGEAAPAGERAEWADQAVDCIRRADDNSIHSSDTAFLSKGVRYILFRQAVVGAG